jgi:hypothetical protein
VVATVVLIGTAGEAAIDVGGILIPHAGPLFLAALALHLAAGLTAVTAAVFAATAGKYAGRHPRAGHVYLGAISIVFATAQVMAAIRWRQDWPLALIAAAAFGLAILGWWTRRTRPRRLVWHGTAMAGSVIALFTGFYVDNGSQLPLWDRLPHWLYWLISAAVGVPLTWRVGSRTRAGAAGPAVIDGCA